MPDTPETTRRRFRRPVVVAAVALAVATVAACGDDDPGPATTVSGSCAVDPDAYSTLSPVPASRLEKLFGDGRYLVDGNVRPGADGVPDAGACRYSSAADPDGLLLEVGVNRQTDLFDSYDESRTLQQSPDARPIEGADGYLIDDPGNGPGSGDHGPLAVLFGDGERTVTVHLVDTEASKGGDATDATLAAAAKQAAATLAKPMERS